MDKKFNDTFEYEWLREKARSHIHEFPTGFPETVSDPAEFFQEYLIQQAELEIQNEALKRTQQSLEKALAVYVGCYYDNCPFGYVTLSEKGIITKANLTCVSCLGKERADLLQRGFCDFVHPLSRMDYFLTLRHSAQSRERQTAELKIVTADKKDLWVLAHLVPDFNDSEELYQWRLAFVDISRNKTREIQSGELIRLLEVLFESMPVGCQLLDENGRIIKSNALWHKMTGLVPEESHNHSVFEYIHPDWETRFRHCISDSIAQHCRQTLRIGLSHKNGRIIHVDAQLHPFPAVPDNHMDLFCFFRERHLTPRLKQKYQATFEPENFHGNVMLIGEDGRIVFANKACRQLLGYSDKALNQLFLWSLASDPNEEEQIRAWFQEISANHPGPVPFQVNYKHADGRTVFCQIDWDYEYDGTGKIIGFLNRLTDLSEIRANEHRLLNEREARTERMARLEKDLESANSLVELLTQKKNRTREEMEAVIQQNMDQRIMPFIEQVKTTRLSKNQSDLIETLEANLTAMLAPFSKHETAFSDALTPMEILISDLIVKGKINKEIAEMLSISVRTVNFHRECLRRKLGIVNKKVNLRSKLMSLVQ